MPIKSLEPYLFELKTVSNCPLDVLRNAVVGIDVEHYLSRLFTPRKEPNLEAIGGLPMTLKMLMDSDFKFFKDLNVKPIFVFSGLRTAIQYSYLEQAEILSRERTFRHVWDDKVNKEYFNESFRDPDSPLTMRPVMDQFMELLDSKNVEYIVSPFSAWAQLQYMLNEHLINCIFGSTDGLLVEGVDRIILSIEFESKQFKYLDKSNIFSKLNLSPKQFKDISMCIGNGFQPFTLNIFPHIPSQSTFTALHHFVLNGGSIYNTLLGLTDDGRSFEIYMKGCSALRFMPVLKLNGRVEPRQINSDASCLSVPSSGIPNSSGTDSSSIKGTSSEKVPEDMHEFIGQRLPDELFFYQSIGLTTFDLCETLVHSNAVERLPPDMALTSLYRRLVTSDNSLDIRGKTINLLANSLNRYYQFKKLKLTTYFNGSEEYELVQRMSPPIFLSLQPLLIRHATARSFDLVTLLSSLSDDFLAECTIPRKASNSDDTKISTNYELISTSLMRTLLLYGFIKEGEFKFNAWGDALRCIARSSYNSQYLLLVLWFFKQFPDLKLSDLLEPYDLHSINKKHKEQAILISKFVGLFSMNNLSSVNYAYKVSRPLLQFRSVFDKLNSNIGGAVRSNLIALLLLNQDDLDKYERDNSEWRKLILELPFRSTLPSVLLGIISQQFFEMYLDNFDLSKSFASINESFQFVHASSSAELIRGFKCFQEVAGLVKLLGEKGLIVDKEVLELFAQSNEFVDQMLSKSA
ncbi:hypothetical protein FOA43_000163 [Brettanomyces nanus]|uniref:Uncharacterized protein n=1 Tax=Eeniella nana TaxID=13502 RepID=A0A875RVF8_EENNA|nr:uncharacterized protein FOA43_000163 [Brettanomyces nanus]QPG72861.1 hypothetical protein FOA43_000163 [Brettanomyces nanus]